jgi:hypothetical protein
LYGQRMIATFLKSWPTNVDLLVYAENCLVQESADNLVVLDLEHESPELVQFKQKWQHVPRANGDISHDPVRARRKDYKKSFKWDAVRFAHKVYAICHAARHCTADWLIWMDADTVCHSVINNSDLDALCPESYDVCYLGRENKYSECGLYALNLRSSQTQEFLKLFQHYYDSAETGIFTLAEWHDSFVFDTVRSQLPLHSLNWSAGLISGEGHPLINSSWGAWLDHLKGSRKSLGRSKPQDLIRPRRESYWQ